MREQIVESLYAAIDETNRQRPAGAPLPRALDTPLYGSSSALDSLELVNFIVAAEQKIDAAFGTSIVLADDRALSQDPSPFRSLGALADYVEVLLKELE
jgi:D-alanine--poly(phosphoribitol) ligase subunit 2